MYSSHPSMAYYPPPSAALQASMPYGQLSMPVMHPAFGAQAAVPLYAAYQPHGSVMTAVSAASGAASPHRRSTKTAVKDKRGYAKHLGVDVDKEPQLYAFLQEAFDCPLPAPWVAKADKKGRVFYWHPTERRSAWKHPLHDTFAYLRDTFRNTYASPQREALIKEELLVHHQRVSSEIQKWRAYTTEEGLTYYYDPATQESTWENPRDVLQYDFDFRQTFLSKILDPVYREHLDAKARRPPHRLTQSLQQPPMPPPISSDEADVAVSSSAQPPRSTLQPLPSGKRSFGRLPSSGSVEQAKVPLGGTIKGAGLTPLLHGGRLDLSHGVEEVGRAGRLPVTYEEELDDGRGVGMMDVLGKEGTLLVPRRLDEEQCFWSREPFGDRSVAVSKWMRPEGYLSHLGKLSEGDDTLKGILKPIFMVDLPYPWSARLDSRGRVYFYHWGFGESQWQHPLEAFFTDLADFLKAHMSFLSTPSSIRPPMANHLLSLFHRPAILSAEGTWRGPYPVIDEQLSSFIEAEREQETDWPRPTSYWSNERSPDGGERRKGVRWDNPHRSMAQLLLTKARAMAILWSHVLPGEEFPLSEAEMRSTCKTSAECVLHSPPDSQRKQPIDTSQPPPLPDVGQEQLNQPARVPPVDTEVTQPQPPQDQEQHEAEETAVRETRPPDEPALFEAPPAIPAAPQAPVEEQAEADTAIEGNAKESEQRQPEPLLARGPVGETPADAEDTTAGADWAGEPPEAAPVARDLEEAAAKEQHENRAAPIEQMTESAEPREEQDQEQQVALVVSGKAMEEVEETTVDHMDEVKAVTQPTQAAPGPVRAVIEPPAPQGEPDHQQQQHRQQRQHSPAKPCSAPLSSAPSVVWSDPEIVNAAVARPYLLNLYWSLSTQTPVPHTPAVTQTEAAAPLQETERHEGEFPRPKTRRRDSEEDRIEAEEATKEDHHQPEEPSHGVNILHLDEAGPATEQSEWQEESPEGPPLMTIQESSEENLPADADQVPPSGPPGAAISGDETATQPQAQADIEDHAENREREVASAEVHHPPWDGTVTLCSHDPLEASGLQPPTNQTPHDGDLEVPPGGVAPHSSPVDRSYRPESPVMGAVEVCAMRMCDAVIEEEIEHLIQACLSELLAEALQAPQDWFTPPPTAEGRHQRDVAVLKGGDTMALGYSSEDIVDDRGEEPPPQLMEVAVAAQQKRDSSGSSADATSIHEMEKAVEISPPEAADIGLVTAVAAEESHKSAEEASSVREEDGRLADQPQREEQQQQHAAMSSEEEQHMADVSEAEHSAEEETQTREQQQQQQPTVVEAPARRHDRDHGHRATLEMQPEQQREETVRRIQLLLSDAPSHEQEHPFMDASPIQKDSYEDDFEEAVQSSPASPAADHQRHSLATQEDGKPPSPHQRAETPLALPQQPDTHGPSPPASSSERPASVLSVGDPDRPETRDQASQGAIGWLPMQMEAEIMEVVEKMARSVTEQTVTAALHKAGIRVGIGARHTPPASSSKSSKPSSKEEKRTPPAPLAPPAPVSVPAPAPAPAPPLPWAADTCYEGFPAAGANGTQLRVQHVPEPYVAHTHAPDSAAPTAVPRGTRRTNHRASEPSRLSAFPSGFLVLPGPPPGRQGTMGAYYVVEEARWEEGEDIRLRREAAKKYVAQMREEDAALRARRRGPSKSLVDIRGTDTYRIYAPTMQQMPPFVHDEAPPPKPLPPPSPAEQRGSRDSMMRGFRALPTVASRVSSKGPFAYSSKIPSPALSSSPGGRALSRKRHSLDASPPRLPLLMPHPDGGVIKVMLARSDKLPRLGNGTNGRPTSGEGGEAERKRQCVRAAGVDASPQMEVEEEDTRPDTMARNLVY
ncbi:unnamed protein product [Vitrella brassicaformis CCMP3155]|uniref:WW domain-containing protein n=2 Tax=Vitrella brassicaformis TaxID=1169539 RepID=A0A0G4GWC3_VITBC|nr:unnamed protein product [Vitrella brassicaformis CCMP3155]|eukprot:CEM35040.1 unnamed protein product [Vitrella brassicaformis CCMP3155]